MKAIQTKYYRPTNFKGSRIKASDLDGNTKWEHYRSELDTNDNHAAAAIALCHKMQWHGRLQGGHLGDDSMVWVFCDKDNQREIER